MQEMPRINFGEVVITRSFLPEIRIALEVALLKLHAKLTPGWALIQVNFDPMQENGPKVESGCYFVIGPFSQDYDNAVSLICLLFPHELVHSLLLSL